MTAANWPRGRDAKENAKEEEAPRTSVTSTLTERRYKRFHPTLAFDQPESDV